MMKVLFQDIFVFHIMTMKLNVEEIIIRTMRRNEITVICALSIMILILHLDIPAGLRFR